MEDDRKVEAEEKHQVEVKKTTEKHKDGQVGLTSSPPPPLAWSRSTNPIRDGDHPTSIGDKESTLGGDNIESCNGIPRATDYNATTSDKCLDGRKLLGDKKVTSVMVNGIDLMELRKMKSENNLKVKEKTKKKKNALVRKI